MKNTLGLVAVCWAAVALADEVPKVPVVGKFAAWSVQSVWAPFVGLDIGVDAAPGSVVSDSTSAPIDFRLTNGANDMLHGYAPATGDVVEWYVIRAACDKPAIECSFSLG